MNQQETPSPREHHFYISIAKFLFRHPDLGIVSVMDPIRIGQARTHGLDPLILYGLTVPGLPIRWMTFAPADQPRALRDVLQEAWRDAEGLRGPPDILRIGRHLSQAALGLAAEMAGIGVRVEVADPREKSLPASLRSAQSESKWIPGKSGRTVRTVWDAVPELCRDAWEDHAFQIRNPHWDSHGRTIADRAGQWLALPTRRPGAILSEGLDWEPGPWLRSWESSLPPDRPRYFVFGSSTPTGRGTWLLTDETVRADTPWEPNEEMDDEFSAPWIIDNAVEVVRDFVDCWPNPPAEIAACAGITLRELRWFTSGKAALAEPARMRLQNLLGIERNRLRGFLTGVGPCVLLARKPGTITNAYDSITAGGDASPCEFVPHRGTADPSWRYVLINPDSRPPSIALFPRGERITQSIQSLLLNYFGTCEVPAGLYRDVVSTCARACREPAANLREMKDFANRHRICWKDGIWMPE